MAIIKVEQVRNYTVMSNYHLRDKTLSLKAKGLMSFCLSLPEDWDYSVAGLVKCCNEGRSSIMSALKELEEHGYLVRERTRNANGTLSGINYTLYQQPVIVPSENEKKTAEEPREEVADSFTDCSPKSENPTLDNPTLDNPTLENPQQIITKVTKRTKRTNYERNKGKTVQSTLESRSAKCDRNCHLYGRYQNVILTDEELEALKSEFPDDWQQRIDDLSSYMGSTGRSYKNHLLTIRDWARRDKQRAKQYGRSKKPEIPKGASGELGTAELEAIQQLLRAGASEAPDDWVGDPVSAAPPEKDPDGCIYDNPLDV